MWSTTQIAESNGAGASVRAWSGDGSTELAVNILRPCSAMGSHDRHCLHGGVRHPNLAQRGQGQDDPLDYACGAETTLRGGELTMDHSFLLGDGPHWVSVMPESGPPPSISVVLPHYRQPDELLRTLRGLMNQDYPRDLFEIIVVDDGSGDLSPREIHQYNLELDLRVLEQRRAGFGLARARNRGARAANGEVLVFLDCDMLPVPQFLESHASFHRRCDHAVVIGARGHIDLEGRSTDEILDVLSTKPDDLGGGLGQEHTREPAWRRRLIHDWREFDDLRAAPYRVASGGNLSVRADRYAEFGETSELFRRWGGEDTEFAFRAWQRGARFAYSRGALAWHQGLGRSISPEERRAQRLQEGLLADLIPLAPFRTQPSVQVHTVPTLWLRIDTVDGDPLALRRWLTELLRTWPDVAVTIETPDTSVRQILAETFPVERRIMVGEVEEGAKLRDAPLRGCITEFDGSQSVQFFPEAASALLTDHGSVIGYRRGTASVWMTRAGSRLALTGEETRLGDLLQEAAVIGSPAAPRGSVDAEIDIDALRRVYWAMPRWLRRAVVSLARALGGRG